MKILVINLDRSPDRLEFQRAQFGILGMEFERVQAVTGDAVDDGYYERMKASGTRLMTRNEVGCFLSHKSCWQICAQGDEAVLVLEDDAVLSPDFAELASGLFSYAKDNSVLVNLEHFSHKKLLGKPVSMLNEAYSIDQMVFGAGGAAAYILTPAIALKVIAAAEQSISLTDTFLYGFTDIDYVQVLPAIAIQRHLIKHAKQPDEVHHISTINAGIRRPGGWESFLASPMSRLRRLRANYVHWRKVVAAGKNLRRNAMSVDRRTAEMLETTRLKLAETV